MKVTNLKIYIGS